MRSLHLAVSLALAACTHDARTAATSAASTGPLAPGDHDLAIAFGGLERHYLVHVPPQTTRGAPLPVIVNYHGGGGNAAHHAAWTQMSPLADREGIVLVFPDGTGKRPGVRKLLTFNAGVCCGPAAANHVDDVGFTFAVLADLARRAPLDRTRVYATGMSNGAAMAYRLAHDAPDRIAAIVTISGANDLGDAPLVPPVPLMHVHSIDDPRALYAGGLGPPFPMTDIRQQHPPVEKVVRDWAKADRCDATPTVGETRHGEPGGPEASHTATQLSWSCPDGGGVVLWRLTGSGHVWPGAGSLMPKLLGAATHVIDANAELWAFVSRFDRKNAPPL